MGEIRTIPSENIGFAYPVCKKIFSGPLGSMSLIWIVSNNMQYCVSLRFAKGHEKLHL